MLELSREKKLELAMKVAEASATYKHSREELLGPSYEGVCKACEVCATSVVDELERIALGYATRYVRRQKFGSATHGAKWNPVEPDKRDSNHLTLHEFRPVDILYILVDLPTCLASLDKEELQAVTLMIEHGSFRHVASLLGWNQWKVQDRYSSAMFKMRRKMGVRV